METHLQVTLGRKGLLTDGASEGLVARMCSHMDLKCRAGAKVLATTCAQVL